MAVNITILTHTQRGLEVGGFSEGAPAVSSRLVIATYNIRYAVGSFLITGSLLRRLGIKRPRRRPSLIESNIKKAAQAFTEERIMPQPHIIALQEADHGTIRAGRRHVARELAERLGYHYVHAPAETPRHEEQKRKQWYLDFEEHIRIDEPGDTGMAILSALPFASAGRIELPSFGCPWRPKLAQQARFSLGDKRHFSIFNAHIDPHASVDQQLVQHEAILDLAGQLSADEPTLLLGDFNTLSPEARVRLRTLLESHGYETPMPTGIATWRAGLYRLHADWIFARNIRTIVRWGIARPLSVSDHWPVWMEIEL